MPNEAEAGTIFIKEGALLPETLRIESGPYMSGWRLVKDLDADGLGRKIQETGWTFFTLAGRNRATVLGREKQNVVRRAVRRMLTKMKSEKFNSMEITGIVPKHFLGVPYVTVSARSRHIQDSGFLLRARDGQEWDRTNLVAA